MGNIVFLFGSGISRKAGMPCTQQITDKVLSGAGVTKERNARYLINGGHHKRDVLPVVAFLKFLKAKALDNSHECKRLNYEDIFYYVEQILNYFNGRIVNPLINPFIVEHEEGINQIVEDWNHSYHRPVDLLSDTRNYILDVVKELLNKSITCNLGYLDFLLEPYQDKQVDRLDVCTLNHDLVLESYFKQKGISYNSGFRRGDQNGMRIYDQRCFNKCNQKIRLLKLHGSINWRSYKLEGNPTTEHTVIFEKGTDYLHSPYIENTRRETMLIGTYNKIIDYTWGIFVAMTSNFYQSLVESNTLIVSGYGFRDEGINSIINYWRYSNNNNKIKVIHPNPEELKAGSNSFFEHWETNQVTFIEKRIEDFQWSDLLHT